MASKSKISSRAAKAAKPAPKRRPLSSRPSSTPAAGASKLDRIVAALRTAKGASVPDLMQLTGWQAHSVRGAMSGALKKDRGLIITSEKSGDERVYRIKA